MNAAAQQSSEFDINDQILQNIESGFIQEGETFEHKDQLQPQDPIHHSEPLNQAGHEALFADSEEAGTDQQKPGLKKTLQRIFVKKNAAILGVVTVAIAIAPVMAWKTVKSAQESIKTELPAPQSHSQKPAIQPLPTTHATTVVTHQAVAASEPAAQTVKLPDGSTIKVAPLPPGPTIADVADKAIELKDKTVQVAQESQVAMKQMAQQMAFIDEMNARFSGIEEGLNKVNKRLDSLNEEIKSLKAKQAVPQHSAAVQEIKPQAVQQKQVSAQPLRKDGPIITAGTAEKKQNQPLSQDVGVEVAPKSKYGITGLTKDAVILNGQKTIRVGDQLPDGATVLRIVPASGIVVTDKVIIKLSQN